MVKSSSPGPIIYKQQRHGINGETIVLDKNNLESPKITEKKVIVKVAGTYGAIVGFTSTLKDYPMTIYMSDLLIRSIGPSTDKLSCSKRTCSTA